MKNLIIFLSYLFWKVFIFSLIFMGGLFFISITSHEWVTLSFSLVAMVVFLYYKYRDLHLIGEHFTEKLKFDPVEIMNPREKEVYRMFKDIITLFTYMSVVKLPTSYITDEEADKYSKRFNLTCEKYVPDEEDKMMVSIYIFKKR